LCNLQQLKIAVFTYRSPHFCFPWRRPCDYHAICCMDGKTIFYACQTPRSMYLSIFNRFRAIRCLNQCVSPKALFYHIFVSPGDAPGAITLNVVWMEREFDAYTLPRSMYPSIFNSFPVIGTAIANNRRFQVPQPTFLFSWRRRCDYHAIRCMNGKTIQCLSNPSQHVPIYLQYFPSYTMLKSMRKSKNRCFYHPFGRHLGNIHAKCCMGGKRIRCLQIVSQHVPIYLQQFPIDATYCMIVTGASPG